jgi:hypothetical protein
MACPCGRAWRQYETLDRKSRRSPAGGLASRCERATELRGDTSRTGTHRLLPRPRSVLSCAIGSCRGQSARAIRRRVVSGNYRSRPSETQTTSATIKAQQVTCMSQRIARTCARDERNCARAEMTGSAISGFWSVSILHIASLMGATCSLSCRLICLAAQGRSGAWSMRPIGTTGKSAKICPAPSRKIFRFTRNPNQSHNSAHLIHQRGVGHVTNAR